jgi:pyruvate dehydrogenase E2 component (dihydrolipoamide acetyltransferase)
MAASMGVDLKELRIIKKKILIRKAQVIEAGSGTLQEGNLIEIHGPRKVMAERMTYSFTPAPHFYLTSQVDVSALVEIRKGLLPKIEAATGKRLTYTDLLLYFLVKALQEFPTVNAAWEDIKIRLHRHINLGIAVDTEQGLIVPVVHQAETLNLGEIVQQRAELVEKARNAKLALEDLENGTFTLTNLGTFRVDLFNAVLNPPQAAILAVGRIHDAIIPVNGSPAIRSVLGLSLTCDHRVMDGALGARFLTRFVEMLEEPVANML